MTTPDHVTAHLNTITGQDFTARGGHNTASWSQCPRCAAPTLIGLDDIVAAITVRADPRALTRSDEVDALLSGRATYTATRDRGRWTLRHRDHWTIAGHPAGTVTVLAAHACGKPLGTPLHAPRTRQEPAHDAPPF